MQIDHSNGIPKCDGSSCGVKTAKQEINEMTTEPKRNGLIPIVFDVHLFEWPLSIYIKCFGSTTHPQTHIHTHAHALALAINGAKWQLIVFTCKRIFAQRMKRMKTGKISLRSPS